MGQQEKTIIEGKTADRDRPCTASEVAGFCHVDLKTIHNWADKGEIRHFRTPGRHLRFRPIDVLDFLRKYGYPIPEALSGLRPSIVVLHEDPVEIASIRAGLRGFEVTAWTDPIQALLSIGGAPPDVVVLDVAIGDLDGIKVVKKLAAMDGTSRIRCVVYSAHDQLRQRAMDAGAYYFVKAGAVAALRGAIVRMMGVDPADPETAKAAE